MSKEKPPLNLVELFAEDVGVGARAIENVLGDAALFERLAALEVPGNDTFGLEVIGDLESLLGALRANKVPKVVGDYYQRSLPMDVVLELNKKLKEATRLMKQERKNAPPVAPKPKAEADEPAEPASFPEEETTD